MSTVIASNVLANGLRTEFADTYSMLRREADARLAIVMDTGINATNRQHEFAYFNAAPHMEFWRRGDPVPQDGFDSVQFTTYVYEWARRIAWSKFDRKDDQTQSLMDLARMAGKSAALLPERFFFDLLAGTTTTIPAVPNAPDGVGLYSATDGTGGYRFGVQYGNLLTGSGADTTAHILTDYYNVLEQFKMMQDGKGQPMFTDDVIDGGLLIVHAADHTEEMETAFLQKRQGIVKGTDAGVTPSNIVQDASRNVMLWGTQRLTGADWYAFLLKAPKKPTFTLDREGLQEFTALEGDQNSDHVRNTGEEYVQWELRSGPGVALPNSTIKVNN